MPEVTVFFIRFSSISVIRPSFGCRQYVTRIISKLLPALKNDFQDWLVETRIKASQLLIVLFTHLVLIVSTFWFSIRINRSTFVLYIQFFRVFEKLNYICCIFIWVGLWLEPIFDTTQHAKDCCPHNRACEYGRARSRASRYLSCL